jgi:hypothetical protein
VTQEPVEILMQHWDYLTEKHSDQLRRLDEKITLERQELDSKIAQERHSVDSFFHAHKAKALELLQDAIVRRCKLVSLTCFFTSALF